MNRRLFLSAAGAALAGTVLDPERLLWVSGKKRIFIPPARAWAGIDYSELVSISDVWLIDAGGRVLSYKREIAGEKVPTNEASWIGRPAPFSVVGEPFSWIKVDSIDTAEGARRLRVMARSLDLAIPFAIPQRYSTPPAVIPVRRLASVPAARVLRHRAMPWGLSGLSGA